MKVDFKLPPALERDGYRICQGRSGKYYWAQHHHGSSDWGKKDHPTPKAAYEDLKQELMEPRLYSNFMGR